MIDPTVIYDKISGFETADEIAAFLTEQGVRANPGQASGCALSVYFEKETGQWTSFGTERGFSWPPPRWPPIGPRPPEIKYECTPAMQEFIKKFDHKEYADLLNEEICEY